MKRFIFALLLLVFVVGCEKVKVVGIQKVFCHSRDSFTLVVKNDKEIDMYSMGRPRIVADVPVGKPMWAEAIAIDSRTLCSDGVLHIHSLSDIIVGSPPPDD